jgi:uncharacterized protein (TIRG00374 family)
MAALIWWGRSDLARLLSLRPLPLVLCLALTLAMALTSVWKWRVCLQSMGEPCAADVRSLFHYFMVGRVLGLVVPMELGDLCARTMSLKFKHDLSLGRGTYSVYLERSFDVAVSAVLLVPSALFILGVVGPGAGMAIALIGFAAGLVCFAAWGRQTLHFLVGLFGLILRGVSRIPGLRNRVKAQSEIQNLAVADIGRVAAKLYLLSGLKFLWTALRFAVVAMATGMAVGVSEILLFAPGAQLALVFSVTPGGLGVVDWSWSGLLLKIGVARNDIVPYLVTLRLAVLASVLVLAGASWLILGRPRSDAAS